MTDRQTSLLNLNPSEISKFAARLRNKTIKCSIREFSICLKVNVWKYNAFLFHYGWKGFSFQWSVIHPSSQRKSKPKCWVAIYQLQLYSLNSFDFLLITYPMNNGNRKHLLFALLLFFREKKASNRLSKLWIPKKS